MSEIPQIDETAIRSRVGAKSFDRSLAYVKDGSVFSTKRRDLTLEARCRGSHGEVYRISVTFGPKKKAIAEADCSCPVGYGGRCKHTAAMLLIWRANPAVFIESESIEDDLARRTQAELIDLVKRMIRRDPTLESLVEATAPLTAGGRRTGTPDAELYRRRAIEAFGDSSDSWRYGEETGGRIADELEEIAEIGEEMLAVDDHPGASAVFRGILDGVAECYDPSCDEEGDVSFPIERCVRGLAACLPSLADEPDEHGAALKSLYSLYAMDTRLGGIGIADGVPAMLDAHATDGERETLASIALESARSFDAKRDRFTRERLAGLYHDLAKPPPDHAAAVFLGLGMIGPLIGRLLDEGKVAEALGVVDSAGFSDEELLDVADHFARRQRSKSIESILMERSRGGKHPKLLGWLRDRRIAEGKPDAALRFARQLFAANPSIEEYRNVRDLASTIPGRWTQTRNALLKALAKSTERAAIVRVHLEEGDVEAAVEALRSNTTIETDELGALKREVALASESRLPWEAIRLDLEVALSLIEKRNRPAYREACTWLNKARRLHLLYGEKTAWDRELVAIRSNYRTLRAFQEELKRAKL